jgi:putative flippase GtrA
MLIRRKLVNQIIFFGLVGAGSFLIDVIVTLFLFHTVGLSAFFASALGFLSAFFFNFPMNRKKVFHHTDNDRFSLRTQATFYTLLCIFNLFATSYLVEVFVSHEIIEIQYAKVLTTLLIAVWNFILFKFLIFSKTSKTSS